MWTSVIRHENLEFIASDTFHNLSHPHDTQICFVAVQRNMQIAFKAEGNDLPFQLYVAAPIITGHQSVRIGCEGLQGGFVPHLPTLTQ